MEKWWVAAQLQDRGKCVYCGYDLYATFQSYWSIQADHLIPQSIISNPGNEQILRSHDVFRGDTVHLEAERNCVTSCVFCNQLKGNWIPNGWQDMDRNSLIEENRRRLAKLRIPREAEYRRRLGLIQRMS